MPSPSRRPPEYPSREVREPVKHLHVQSDGTTTTILTTSPDGAPVKMDAVETSLLADLLRELSAPGFPDYVETPDSPGYEALTTEICVDMGFCGSIKHGRPLYVDLLIPPSGPVTADQFVEWVFLADDMNPNERPDKWQRHKDAIRAAFVRHMGAETVDARQLRYDFET
jgi:hypothetical protein